MGGVAVFVGFAVGVRLDEMDGFAAFLQDIGQKKAVAFAGNHRVRGGVEDHGSGEVAGLEAVFHVGVKRVKLPALFSEDTLGDLPGRHAVGSFDGFPAGQGTVL